MKPEHLPKIEWRMLPFDSGAVRSEVGALTPFVGGQSLTTLVDEYERGRGYEPAGGYAGLMVGRSADEWRAYLYGQFTHRVNYWPPGRAALLGCSCSDDGCWPLLARVTSDDGVISWDQFQQPHRPQRDYGGFGPFVFDAAHYARAVEQAVALEATRRRTSRPARVEWPLRDENDPAVRRLHLIVLARELTAKADVPLRDRHYLAVPDEHVMHVLDAVATHPDDAAAVAALDATNMTGEIELQQAYYTPCDEATLYRIVAALRPLTDNDYALARIQPGRRRRRTDMEFAGLEAAIALHGEPDD